ncbi:MAG: response regulator [Proteobacteria bacterium]|nr:response regulator [Pseudomonadota bacterium]
MKTILLVEDDVFIRESLAELLKMEKYKVVEAPNGEKAKTLLLQGFIPDLIVLDLLMPVMSGEQFLQDFEIRPVLELIPVIVLTAGLSSGLPPKIVRAIIAKPPNIEKLLQTVRILLSYSDLSITRGDGVDRKDALKNLRK